MLFHGEFGVYPLSLEVEIGYHASDGLFLAMEYKGSYKTVISHFLEISVKGI